MSEQTRYYIKELHRTAPPAGGTARFGAPNWVVYERIDKGARTVCLCYEQSTAEHILRLLISDDATALSRSNGQEPTGTI